MKYGISVIVSLFALTLTGASGADPKPDDAVAYRQGIMMALGWNIGPLGAMVKGEMPFDARQFAFMANRAALLAPMALEGFPPSSAGAKSEAKAALWKNYDDFKQRMKDLNTATTRLSKVAAGGDEGAMKAEFVEAVKTCKGCHDEYQKEH